jgi:GTP:adenosylcobinamide-phosphate guanylyltransferase
MTTITIDGVDHTVEDLTSDQKAICVAITKVDEELSRLNHLVAALQTARQAYVNDLGSQLNGTEEFK